VTAIADGPVCSCGKRGCLEAVVADPALVAIAREDGVIGKRQGLTALRDSLGTRFMKRSRATEEKAA